jgi:hypothetical protein
MGAWHCLIEYWNKTVQKPGPRSKEALEGQAEGDGIHVIKSFVTL